MIPKLTIFATLRSSLDSVAGSLPSTSAAVAVWMSSLRSNAARSTGSPETGGGTGSPARAEAALALGVVGRRQPEAVLGDERRPDLAAEVGADRDRLQVRARRREASGR